MSADGAVGVYDADSGQEVVTLAAHRAVLGALAYSADGSRLATGGQDRIVRIWDATTGTELVRFKGHNSSVTRLVFHPDGRRLMSYSPDGTIKSWDLFTSQEALILPGNQGLGLAFSPDSTLLAGALGDGRVLVWSAATGQERSRFHPSSLAATSVAFSPDGLLLASAGEDHTVRIWDLATGKEGPALADRPGTNLRVRFCPEGSRVAVVGMVPFRKPMVARGLQEMTLNMVVWNPRTGEQARVPAKDLVEPIRVRTFLSPDGRNVAAVSSGTLHSMQRQAREAIVPLTGAHCGRNRPAHGADERREIAPLTTSRPRPVFPKDVQRAIIGSPVARGHRLRVGGGNWPSSVRSGTHGLGLHTGLRPDSRRLATGSSTGR
jgi:hypothetical protein